MQRLSGTVVSSRRASSARRASTFRRSSVDGKLTFIRNDSRLARPGPLARPSLCAKEMKSFAARAPAAPRRISECGCKLTRGFLPIVCAPARSCSATMLREIRMSILPVADVLARDRFWRRRCGTSAELWECSRFCRALLMRLTTAMWLPCNCFPA